MPSNNLISGRTALALLTACVAGLVVSDWFGHDLIFRKTGKSDAGEAVTLSSRGLPVGCVLKPIELVSLDTGLVVKLFHRAEESSQADEGRFVVLVFFTVRCPGCAKMKGFWRSLIAMCQELGHTPFLVTFDSDREQVTHFTRLMGIHDLPILYDGVYSNVAGAFDVDFVPTVYVFKSNGKLVRKWLGIRWYKDGQEITDQDKLQEVKRLFAKD